jgi:site-specific DNA-adenine methylase
MRYFGGKGIQGKQISAVMIAKIIEEYPNAIYLEPFCGALGVLRHMSKFFKKCYANDSCKDLIMLLKMVKNNNFENPKITKEKWIEYKYSKTSSAQRAFAGFGCSYSGIFFNGYVGVPSNNDMIYSSLIKLIPKIQNVVFSNKDYIEFLKQFPFGSNQPYIIYMDPPYKDTSCQPWEDFDSTQFWNIVRKLSKIKGVKIIVSEISAPSDFKCIYKFKRKNGMHNITDKVEIEEKLYTI